MPHRPAYAICPGDRIGVEVVQPDGSRALVVGKLDKVPEAAGGRALWIVVCDAEVRSCLRRYGTGRSAARPLRGEGASRFCRRQS